MKQRGMRQLVKSGKVHPQLILTLCGYLLHERIVGWLERQRKIQRDYEIKYTNDWMSDAECIELTDRLTQGD